MEASARDNGSRGLAVEGDVRTGQRDTIGLAVTSGSDRRAVDTNRGEHLLDVRDLRVGFDTSTGMVTAVDGVSLTVDIGQTLGIVGESGSGKSVLARTLLGLLPPPKKRHVTGEVWFEGRNMLAMSENQLREIRGGSIAMIFQDPMTSLHPVYKIGAQITDVLRLHGGMSRSEADAHAVELLRRVSIAEPERRVQEYPHQLSGGMRQRVMIAIATACEPNLLLADEPTTALDLTVQAQILDLLDGYQAGHGMAMILVSHDLGVVGSRCHEIAVMYAGRIVEQAPSEVIFSAPRMPYTKALMESIPTTRGGRQARLATIPGRPPDPREPRIGCSFAPRCRSVQDRCREESPPLVSPDRDDHRYACWFPEPVAVDTPQVRSTAGSA
ncbi:MAG: ABC transporter ATP-binding protein [Microbacterium sp.]